MTGTPATPADKRIPRTPESTSLQTVAAFLRIDSIGEQTSYPQVGLVSDSSHLSVQLVYWRTATVFYASSVRANPHARHILFTNGEPPIVDGTDLSELFRELGVELVDVPFTHRPPPGYFDSWGNQFWILDLIAYLASAPCRLPAIIFDVDCVFVAPGERLMRTLATEGVLNYVVEDIEADPAFSSNGLTTPALQQVSEEIVGRSLPRVRYCGGELFGATPEVATAILQEAGDLWQRCLDRHARGLPTLNTEEHFFSCLYATLGLPVGTGNGMLRRIWTQRTYRNESPMDLDLVVWHLPAEKKYGFRRVFGEVTDPDSLFWRLPVDATFATHLGQRFGIPSPTLGKQVRDVLTAGRERIGASRRS